MKYAEVIIDIASEELDRSFSYRIPKEMEAKLRIGMIVSVPFGRGDRTRKGYVVAFAEETTYPEERVKDIVGIVTDEETTESRLIALAAWIREAYGSTMIQALKTVLPIQQKMKTKQKRFLQLIVSESEARRELSELQKTRFHARTRLLQALLAAPDHRMEYAFAAREYGTTTAVVEYFFQKGILKEEIQEEFRQGFDLSGIPREPERTLSEPQKAALAEILSEWEQPSARPVLIHGVTGSGKTEVYMQLIRRTLAEGKQAIVLIPEIALTYQTVRRFCGQFGDQVSVLHSRMSAGERYDQFRKAREGKIQIMVGPRSALFTPFPRLGLLIMDEEHENAYKSESSPRYHAREVACERARMEHAKIVLGSATPSLESYQNAMLGNYRLVKLAGRFEERSLPEVSIVDLREELRAGNRSMFSRELAEGLKQCLETKEQAMLFLNRRGYAGFITCRSCGYVVKCPHCDVSLSQHDRGRLLCHYCGYETRLPESCPDCGSPYIGGFKAGTQQVEKAISQILPKARILRMDYDTTRTKGSYEEILSTFHEGRADILIGTQMIVKGHDFPNVTLVGVLAADLSLSAADFRSGERTFQLLTQAVGRSGRGRKRGKAVIQTYHPEHYSIRLAAVSDYEGFFEEEMLYREMMHYPPAASMMAVLGAGENEEQLSRAMKYLAEFAERAYSKQDLGIIGPAAASVSKIKDVYHQVLYLKHRDRRVLVWIREQMEKYIEINSGFRSIYIQFDI